MKQQTKTKDPLAEKQKLVCKNCWSDSYSTELKGNNIVARCKRCQSFIKNIPYDEPKIYFGKYSGVPIREIDDAGYLKWAVVNLNISSTVRDAITKQINVLDYLAK